MRNKRSDNPYRYTIKVAKFNYDTSNMDVRIKRWSSGFHEVRGRGARTAHTPRMERTNNAARLDGSTPIHGTLFLHDPLDKKSLVELCETKGNFRDSLKPPRPLWVGG